MVKSTREIRSCGCGCGRPVSGYDYHTHQPIRFVAHHSRRGLWWYDKTKHPTLGKKRPDASIRMKTNNPNWSGDKVGKSGVHAWVRKRLPMPEFCELCNKSKPHDLANMTGEYSREFKNWKYLCRKCHMESDGRMRNLSQYSKR